MIAPLITLILPAFNGLPYLRETIPNLLANCGSNTEILVSDGGSRDGTLSFLRSIKDDRLTIVSPKSRTSMAEHWDWAAGQASGEWQMFIGQDDFLRSNFQSEVSRLISEAETQGLDLIVAKRAFYDWPGSPDFPEGRTLCEPVYTTKTRLIRVETIKSLCGLQPYHDLPQMYTSSLVRRKLLEEIRASQRGKLFVTHPQDASMVASINHCRRTYLWSGVPFSWVGTSPKSAGLAVSRVSSATVINEDASSLAKKYIASIDSSTILYPPWAGSFLLAENAIYLWQALAVRRELDREDSLIFWRRASLLLALVGVFIRNKPFSRVRSEKARELVRVCKVNGVPAHAPAVMELFIGTFGFPLFWLARSWRRFKRGTRSQNQTSQAKLSPIQRSPEYVIGMLDEPSSDGVGEETL